MPCSDAAWHKVLSAYYTHTTETIRVPRAALTEVIDCGGGKVPPGLITREPRQDSTTVEVNRAQLFEFIQLHGHTCIPR